MQYGLSYRNLVAHMESNKGALKACGMKKAPSKSKLHVIADPYDKIVGFEVTEGTAGDSPIFRDIFPRISKGSGIVALDAAYDSEKSCRLIVGSGRVPVIRTKSNANPRWYGARAKMHRWEKERPAEFDRAYGVCSLVESIFSSMKRRTGAFVRVKSLPARTVEPFAKVLCHNMTT
ncbi:MAG: hypothetical protein EB829_03055 [Nitrosopumilus sp. H8]|nr:MAG: hypothetical protein EB829_03055 [Nitrosopumilus sp. H8]